jgi:hypothetical protein
LSDKTDNFENTKGCNLIDDLLNGEGIITLVNPLGYVVS